MNKEQVQKFNSDFKVVADYFAQIYENGYYRGNPQELKHPEDTFTLMKYVTGVEKFEQFINAREEGGATNMYDPFEDAEKRMLRDACIMLMSKSSISSKVDLILGGDLSNQIFSSTSSIIEYEFPYIGIYAACASGILAMIIASIYMNQLNLENSLIYEEFSFIIC